MTNEILEKAQKLKEDIRSIDMVLRPMQQTWRVKVTSKTPKVFVGNIAYGMYEERSFKCDAELTQKIIKLIEDHKASLEKQYEELT